MPIIPVKNGTTSITVECTSLTQLEYDIDTDVYRCEFNDWAFGLFAILSVLLILLPIILIIRCWVKWHHKNQTKNFRPSFSTRTSYSSLYPPEHVNRDNDLEYIISEVCYVFLYRFCNYFFK